MNYYLKNNKLELVIDSFGAQITSVKLDGIEKLWQNDNGSWEGHAPLLFPVCRKLMRADLVVAVDAENGGAQSVQSLLVFLVSFAHVIVCAYIAQKDNDIIFFQLPTLAEHLQPRRIAVDITGIIDHCHFSSDSLSDSSRFSVASQSSHGLRMSSKTSSIPGSNESIPSIRTMASTNGLIR